MKSTFKRRKVLILISLTAAFFLLLSISGTSSAQEPFVGEIRMFAGNFAPRGWAFCDGQLMQVSEYDALFSIIGATYGGDGITTFALPDLRGRSPMHPGLGPGLTPRNLGQKNGAESVTLNISQIPSHNHTAAVNSYPTEGNSAAPGGGYWAKSGGGDPDYNSASDTTMAAGAISVDNAGGSQPHNNMSPFVCVHYIISLVGIYPSRD